jgi:hypothetical protein
MRRFATFCLVLPLSLPFLTAARADAVTDALQAATTAYGSNDLKGTADQLALATEGLRLLETDMLNKFLPPAPDGFTAALTEDYGKGFSMLGGGIGTETTYSNDQTSFKLDITADSPLVASMAPMLANVQMMTAMGKVVKIGDVMALEQDDDQSLSALVGNRILVQMQGADVATMLPLFQKIDFAGLATYDKK